MAEMLFKTKGNGSPGGKARVYFTCHADDFGLYFEQVCEYFLSLTIARCTILRT